MAKSEKINFKKIEKKWQDKWEKAKVFEAKPDKRKKFFVTFPYPYMNAIPHIGHFYTLMRVEAFARYKRMRSFNVLFPQGWHCTGSPIVAAAQRITEGEKKQVQSLEDQGFPSKEIEKMKKPENWPKIFTKIWTEAYKFMGISYDSRRSFITTSLNPYYDKFIQWQFRKLKEKGYVTKGKHPVVWDPKTNMPVGDHDRVKGEGVVPQEFTLLKFKFDGGFLVAATLRPETIYGQTNLWIHPDIIYKKANVNNEVWIVSEECLDKLKEQDKKIEIIEDIKGKNLIGKYAIAPGIEREIIILPASFVDPTIGTGIVTSVPSDAPYDYIALKELQCLKEAVKKEKYGFAIDQIKAIEEIEVIPIIKTNKYGDKTAVNVVEKENIISQDDPKLEELTQTAYKEGFHNGIMLETCGKYKGMKVTEAKEKIKKDLIKNGKADLFYELTDEIVSRNLNKCIVKIVSDQWFIRYSDKKWKKRAHSCLKNLKLYPEIVREQFSYVIDWLNDWACSREYGLGTRLPFDQKWLIESLSDSTIYMAYYTISHLVNNTKVEKINDNFFDYIFLNKNKKLNIKNIDKMRKEFEYWYPLDFRNSGKDLVQNHLTFFLFNHVAIFNKKKWPRGIGVNGWVRVGGEKMSKSLGNMVPIKEIAKKFGADVSRLTILNGGEGLDDPNWDSKFAEVMNAKLLQWHKFVVEHYNKGRTNKKDIDNWMDNELNNLIKDAENFMEKTLFRSAIQKIYFDLQGVLKWYLQRVNTPNKNVINRVIEVQTLLLSPFAPHTCEEIWEKIGRKGFVSLEQWPKIKKIRYDGDETYIKNVLKDIKSILKLVKFHPKKVYLYTIPKEKKLLLEAKDFFEREFNLKFDVFTTNEKNKYDPQNKASRSKKYKPAIYLE